MDERKDTKAKIPLNATLVRTCIKPGKYYDSQGTGLFLLIMESGKKYWLQRMRVNGKRREVGLGTYPEVSLSEARDKAAKNRLAARDGTDPVVEKQIAMRESLKEGAIPTFEELARKRHRELESSFKKTGSSRPGRYGDLRLNMLANHVFPYLGDFPITEIKALHIKDVLMTNDLWLDKPATGRKVRQRIRDVMGYAVGCGYRDDDPTSAISKILPKQTKAVKHRPSLPYQRIPEAIIAIRSKDGWEPVRLGIEFLILTATRPGEVIGARWREIDEANRDWIIPAERNKISREHIIPLSDQCMEILDCAKFYAAGKGEDDLIFPSLMGRGEKQLSDMAFTKVMRDLELDGVPHGFRASFRTWTQEQTDAREEVAEAALGHVTRNAVKAAYARSDYLDIRRPLMQRWADFVDGKHSGDVVSIKSKASKSV